MRNGVLRDPRIFIAAEDSLGFRGAARSLSSRHRRSAARRGGLRSATAPICRDRTTRRVSFADDGVRLLERLWPAVFYGLESTNA
jgi:hypothetical protein